MAMRLKKDGVSIKDIFIISNKYYKSKAGDDKRARMKIDIVGAKITAQKNFTYDKSTLSWKTSEKRHVKFEFIVSSKPLSYKKTDTINIHKFPVVILMYDIEMGLDSPFRFRSGSFKKPIFPPKNCSPERRLKITNANIKNGVDLGFFFDLSYVLYSNSLLFGPNFATRPPVKTNPKGIVFFDKHTLTCIKILVHILNNPTAMSKIKKVYKKEDI